jgi:hypothetical protein
MAPWQSRHAPKSNGTPGIHRRNRIQLRDECQHNLRVMIVGTDIINP